MYKYSVKLSIFILLLLSKYTTPYSDKIEYKYGNTKIVLDYGNIEEQQFIDGNGAIVNAANKYLQGGGGVDGAIHKAVSGQKMHNSVTCPLCMHARNNLTESGKKWTQNQILCPTGQARITPAFKLSPHMSHIIHAVGPAITQVKTTATPEERKQLADTYTNSLTLAQKNNIHAIAFPQISVGIFNYPLHDAVLTVVTATLNFIRDNPTAFKEIRFIMWERNRIGRDGYALYKHVLHNISTTSDNDNVRIISYDPKLVRFSNDAKKTDNAWNSFVHWFLRLI